MTDDIENALRSAMFRLTGAEEEVADCRRLSGGASMESWSFDFAGGEYVLRRAPSDALMTDRPFDHTTEAALVTAAQRSGVSAPEVVGVLTPADGLGSGYVMRRIGGTANPAAILREAQPALIADIARELAAIHAVKVADLPDLPAPSTGALLDDLHDQFDGFGADRPVIALALKWCRDNLPPPVSPRLVHGDFRMGNIMVEEGRLSGVLDWELAHIGDAHEDIAWGCVGAWRFGRYDRPAFGLATFDRYFAAYEQASRVPVDRARVRYWLIHRTIWWALGCLRMGAIWREGADRSLERAVIARRTVENEIDLLLLLDDDAAAVPIVMPENDVPSLTGETHSAELLDAVSEWIGTRVKPAMQGHDRFLSAVAMNAMGIAARDIRNPGSLTDALLAKDILNGTKDASSPGMLADLKRYALRKGATDVPKYAGLAAAKEKWT